MEPRGRSVGSSVCVPRRLLTAVAVIGSVAFLGAFQASVTGQAPPNVTRGCVEKYDATKDYFPDKVTVEDAVNFTVTYHRSYKVVSARATGPATLRNGMCSCNAGRRYRSSKVS